MDLEVKKEVLEDHLNTASHHQNSTEPIRGEEEATLAQMSMSSSTKVKRKPKPKKIFTADEPIKSTKKKEKIILKIRKTQSDPTEKQAVAESGGKCKSFKRNKDPVDGPCPHAEVKSAAMIRAEEVRSNLEPAYPSFAKSMVRSHVASCFWMGIPGQFCKLYLPTKDANVVLEDECGKLYEAKYFAEKTGLSAGWRQFSTGHNLVEGDVLVFQLVEPLKFKVYIIRANDFSEVDGALGLLNLDAHTKQNDLLLEAHTKQNDADLNFDKNNSEMKAVPNQNTRRKRQRSLPLAVVQKKNKKSQQSISASNIGQPAEQSENDSEDVGSEVLEGFKLSIPAVQFKDITSLDNFNIFVDGSVIDSELPEGIRCKYYELCCTRNALLHDSLIQGINIKLISGIISETVNISEAIRNCNLSNSHDEFATWDKTLKAFELLGMNVGFLRVRIHQLLNLAFESEGAKDARRYAEAKAQQATAMDEIRNIEARLEELKGACENFCAEIESLKWKAELYEHKFQEEVNAPW